jgi:hypothetical protein
MKHAAWLVLVGCGPTIEVGADIEASQIDGVWVFAYTEDPGFSMEALHTGSAAVVEDCLYVGGSVVVWRPDHLEFVEQVVSAVAAGSVVEVSLSGGGDSLAEGSAVTDFPTSVVAKCAADTVWYAGAEDPQIVSP